MNAMLLFFMYMITEEGSSPSQLKNPEAQWKI
jgi:hypothetical protein